MSEREYRGRLFGPGLPGAGTPARASWDFGRLALNCAEGEFTTEAADLKAAAGGFNHSETRLTWQTEAGPYAFHLDAADAPAFAAAAPAALAAHFSAAGKRRSQVERRFRLGWAALGLILLLPFLLVVIFYLKAEALADWVTMRIPAGFESQIGDLTLAQARAHSQLLENGPAVDAVRRIGAQLVPATEHHYRWFIAQSPEINAYAAPGGVVVVNAGLIRAAASAEELAAVLAHEVSHIELRHSLKSAVKNIGFSALLALALGDYSGSLAAQAAAHLSENRFSRDAEREADRAGLQRLVQAGIDPRALPRFFTKLAATEGNAKLPTLLSTHPPSTHRSSTLETEIAALPPRHYTPLAIDWAAVKAALGENSGKNAGN